MSAPNIEVYEDAAGRWRFRVVGGNGEPMAASEAYTRKADAQRGADALKAAIVATSNATSQDGECDG